MVKPVPRLDPKSLPWWVMGVLLSSASSGSGGTEGLSGGLDVGNGAGDWGGPEGLKGGWLESYLTVEGLTHLSY